MQFIQCEFKTCDEQRTFVCLWYCRMHEWRKSFRFIGESRPCTGAGICVDNWPHVFVLGRFCECPGRNPIEQKRIQYSVLSCCCVVVGQIETFYKKACSVGVLFDGTCLRAPCGKVCPDPNCQDSVWTLRVQESAFKPLKRWTHLWFKVLGFVGPERGTCSKWS